MTMNIKKEYQQPAAQVCESQTETIIALSIMDGKASSSADVLVKGNDWSQTDDEDDDDDALFE